MGSPILEQLREQTRPAHLALETQPILQRLLSSELTRTEYGHLLQAMLVFYQSLETELIPATETLLEQHPCPDYHYVPRLPLLIDDCQALGVATTGFNMPSKEFRLEGSGPYLLGVLYVIEGATQGGRLIARHLADTLGVSNNSGASFFNMHQWNNSWASFRRWVDRNFSHMHQDDIPRIIAGADMTFSALHTHLDQWQPLTHGR